MLATTPTYSRTYQVTWEKLPADFVLPDDPVDNINQPALAAALTESLQLANKLPDTALTPTNYGICATINGKFAVKAPDWAFIAQIGVDRSEVVRSYTPRLQGEIPTLVLEFLSDTEGGEYSVKETFPVGKFFYYEQILQVPNYGIFDPDRGVLELYRLDKQQINNQQIDNQQKYRLAAANAQSRFWIPEMQLFLGVWQGTRENRDGHWLRWWDEQDNLLLWGTELVTQEQQRTEMERQRAEAESQRAEAESQRAEAESQRAEAESQRSARLTAQLRAAGIDPDI